jgi:hypothetical protein
MWAKVLGALVGVAVMLAPAAPAHATTAADLVGYLNTTRATNGFPTGITENAQWSADCHQHNLYGRQNNTLDHSESPDKAGYSAAGDQIARESVLYRGRTWTASSNPFESAPMHLSQAIQPRIDVMGADETDGFGCATTFSSRNRAAPPADVVYTYPGDSTGGWYTDEVASEGPYSPGEAVGIPRGTRTGIYLLAFPDGPGLDPNAKAAVTCAALVGPDGPLDVVATDNSHPKLNGFLPTEVVVIPRSPLRTNATYAVAIAAIVTPIDGGSPRAFVRRWSFRTGSGSGAAPSASCPTPDPGAPPASPSTTSNAKHAAGAARKLPIAFPQQATNLTTLILGIANEAVGRPATLKVRVVKRRCTSAASACRYLRSGEAYTRSIASLASALPVRLPRRTRGRFVEVKLTIPKFRAADGTRYATTTVMRRFR